MRICGSDPDWLRHDMDYDILSDMHKLEHIYEKSLENQYRALKKNFDLNNNAVDQEFPESWRYRNG